MAKAVTTDLGTRPESTDRAQIERELTDRREASSEPASPRPARRKKIRLSKGERVPGTPYRIVEWLAEGGMGAVYRARHVDIDRVVALKVLHGAGGDDEGIEQLRREAKITAGIEAPNIVEVFDFLRMPDGRVAMAMEIVEGRTLRNTLLSSRTLAPGRVIAILRQVCRGLGAAHAAGLVHLDIKPENIMLCERDGREDFVKLLDFGIASTLGEAEHEELVGTAAYIAPDRILDQTLDGRTDLYSLGCVAYEMLTGRAPFKGEVTSIMEQHLDAPPPDASKQGSDVPPALGALVRRCMAKEPSERPKSAADLEAALCEAQIEARLQTPWDDLPLPDVEPERRARLMETMPQPERDLRRDRQQRWWSAATVVGLLAIGAVAMLRDEPPAVAAAEDERIEDLATQAYAAAAKTFYFYPPVDAPQADTAYTLLSDLDGLGQERPAALERAEVLRGEFADALTRLGDKYWDEEGGRAFAIDYYAQALMFDDGRDLARQRANLSVGQFNELRGKAGERAFTPDELRSVAPLRALAIEDVTERSEQLERLALDPERSSRAREQLHRLAGTSVPRVAAARARKGSPAPDEAETAASASEAKPERKAASSSEAKALVTKASAEARAGRAKQAEKLFNRALKADPGNLAALVGLGDLHFDAGNYTESARHRRAATRRAPNKASLRIGLGDALLKTFRYDDAMVQYKRAATLGHPEAADRIARLEKRMGR